MISIDTVILRQLVSACSAANESINDAVDALNRVTIHNDWNCKERDSINEYTNQNKIKIRSLQEKSKSFLNTLTLVSHDFENAEASISDMFSSLDGILGSVIAIPLTEGPINTETWVQQTPQRNPVFGSVVDWIKEQNVWTNPPAVIVDNGPSGGIANWLDHHELTTISDPISVCFFDDIKLD